LFIKNGLFGYIDTTGKVVIPPQFENAMDFKEGLAPVRINRPWGYIDKDVKFAIAPQYDFASQFENGIAHIGLKGKDGFIDKNNKRFFEDD